MSLKPLVCELLYKEKTTTDSHFDVVSCQGTNYQEKTLGHLFILGNIKYEPEEDLSYLINLISSLSRREYYSLQSIQTQDPKIAFEKTLKKLNEVLENFFANKNLKLDIGLAVIARDILYISRIGKCKVGLARNSEYIDVINNIELFNKEETDEEMQFSNIISGKIKPNDKIFAYIPFRSITSREKQIRTLLSSQTQAEFSDKIAQLASANTNFNCCAVHIFIQEIKEIPSESVSVFSALPTIASLSERNAVSDSREDATDDTVAREASANIYKGQSSRSHHIIARQMEVVKKYDLKKKILGQYSKLSRFSRPKITLRGFTMIVLGIIIPLAGIIGVHSYIKTRPEKNAYSLAKANQKTAESRIAQGDTKDARLLLLTSLENITKFNTKTAEQIKKELLTSLNAIDKTASVNLIPYAAPTPQNGEHFSKLAVTNNKVFVVSEQYISEVSHNNSLNHLNKIAAIPSFIFTSAAKLFLFDGNQNITVVNSENQKKDTFAIDTSESLNNALLYKDNLYALTKDSILKYSNIIKGSGQKTTWYTEKPPIELNKIAIDGNIYVLTNDNHLRTYFKGKNISDVDLKIALSKSSRIFTTDDSQNIYLVDPSQNKIFVFEKSSVTLKKSFSIPYAILDSTLDNDENIWFLNDKGAIFRIEAK